MKLNLKYDTAHDHTQVHTRTRVLSKVLKGFLRITCNKLYKSSRFLTLSSPAGIIHLSVYLLDS